jgi:2-oxo-3-hexenedioate decarboxylase
MKQMGVETPCFGFPRRLFQCADGGEIKISELIHPKVEPEIAFVMKRALKGPGCHIGAVLAATDFVMPGIEVIDSRYRDFKFDLKSVIADNCSSSRFVLGGQAMPVAGLDMRTLGVVMEKNGEVVAIGAGAAVLGHPAAAIAMLANHLGARGEEIPAGTMILSGGRDRGRGGQGRRSRHAAHPVAGQRQRPFRLRRFRVEETSCHSPRFI